MKVFIYRTMTAVLILLLLFACEKERRHANQTSSEKVSLTYWSSSNAQEIKLAKKLVALWNASHPDIQVKVQPLPSSQSSEEVLLAAIAGGTTPDLCSNIWPGAMDDFISAGGLVRLDTFPDFWTYMNERVPEDLLKSFKAKDGGYYQIPWKTNPIMVFYNKKIFREAGVQAPLTTYSEFLKAAEKIVRDRDGDGEVDHWMLYREVKPIWWQRLFDYYPFYICASGGKTLFKGDVIDFNNDASVKVFAFFQTMYRRGFIPITQFQGDQYLSGKLATQISGPWFVAQIEKFKQPGFEYDIMPIPKPDDYKGTVYTYGDPKNISIFNTTKHPAQAWQFAKWLISRQADLNLLQIANQIPIRKDLLQDSLFSDYFKNNPKMVIFAKQAPYTRGVDGVADLKEIFSAISQEYEACVIYDRRTPEEAIKRAAKRVEVIREWNRL
ncbi:MAG: extracellular solute-binding protein [Calditrichaeota bacterium]|nr:extracellular solute-binding protein [Calditrichota bacterium]